MTREEKALKASKRFEMSLTESDILSLSISDIGFAFQSGKRWADNNPKSPWISVKYELPCDNPNNIHFGFPNRVLATDGENIFVAYMKKDKDNKWIWCSEDNVDISHIITHWMPFPEPPKA